MTKAQIQALGPALSRYLGAFEDCFAHPDTRDHLRHYISGQLSNLPRKSVEPMAHWAEVPPRTLQEFLSLSQWDDDRLRDRVQQIVAREHAEAQGILIVDESGHPKKGNKTACVHREYCGASGKIDNCVMSVHLCYASFDGQFRTMIDSDLYLPEKGWNDQARRREAGIPEALVYRPKYQIALEQVQRAKDNGICPGWVVADEWYGQKPAFIAGLEALARRFVLEIPKNVMGWTREPKSPDTPRGQVRNLVRWSKEMRDQEWIKFHIKDTGMGPMVWEARAASFWMWREGRVVGPYWLLAARDVLDPQTIKYFLSNASGGVPEEVILHVGFARWPVERTLEDEKSELGLSHFEVRKYPAILRHLRITQVSHLFLARQTRRLREKKSGGDHLPGAGCGQRHARRPDAEPAGPDLSPDQSRQDHPRHSSQKRQSPRLPRQRSSETITPSESPRRDTPLLHSAAERIAL
ncbi:MAG TPA: IS701 family transposase [Terracidiphilus sp.]|nr:IS701 family transposase [Terracidiphilus sp.]